MKKWSSSSVDEVVKVLRQGGVVAYPTEAVYGLGCDPQNIEAIERVFELKQRKPEQGFLLIGADVEQINLYVDWSKLSSDQRNEVFLSWPGPNTWVLPAASDVPKLLTGAHFGIAVRVTAHNVSAELCKKFGGALLSTSANLHGQTPARSSEDVISQFSSTSLDGVLVGSLGGALKPSVIRDALTGNLIRSG